MPKKPMEGKSAMNRRKPIKALGTEAPYEDIVERSADGIAIVQDDVIRYVNSRLAEMWGGSIAEILGTTISAHVHSDDRPIALDRYARRLAGTPVSPTYETRLINKDGRTVWADVSGGTILYEGRTADLLFIRDVDERKRAEVALRASEEKYRLHLENISDVIYSLDTELNVISVSPSVEKALGYKPEELIGKPFTNLSIITPESLRTAYSNIPRILAGEATSSTIYEFLTKDGRKVTAEVSGTPMFREGKIIGLVAVARDITERKRMEDALRASEARFATVFYSSPVSIAITRLDDNTLMEINEAWLKITGYGREESVGHTPHELNMWADPAERSQLILRLREQGIVQGFEIKVRRKSGEIANLLMSAERIDVAGDPCLLTMALDITQRQQAEEKVRASLKEKEVLLRELHHRVKNNMQIISSLLNLQSAHVADPAAVQMFKDTQRRIKSMALVHEKLYQSQSLSTIEFDGYLESLAVHLFHSYENEASGIELVTNMDRILLDIQTAIPCGLLVNELLSNALKHAFPGDRKGRIELELRRLEDDRIFLRVKDDGIGLPGGFDIHKAQTLGIQIVADLVSQLDGTLEISGDGGTEFRIIFKEPGRQA